MHSGINEKNLCDLKCAVSYERAGASYQAQYLGNLWSNTQKIHEAQWDYDAV